MAGRPFRAGSKIPETELVEMREGKLLHASTAHLFIPFEVIHLGEELTMRGVKAASGVATVPQIFIEGKLIGGADQLAQHLA